MPLYVSSNQLTQSFNNLASQNQKTNSFLGLLTLLLHGRSVTEKNYWQTDMIAFAKHLDEVFYLNNEKPRRNGSTYWFTLFQPDWTNIVFELLLKSTRISLQDCAIVLMWHRPFENMNDLITTFIHELKKPELIETCFSPNIDEELTSTHKCEIADLQKKFNVTSNNYTLSFDTQNLLSKPAGDISGAPFAQTLYAGTSFRKAFTVCDFDFLDTYKLQSTKTTKIIENNKEWNINPFLEGLKKSNLVLSKQLPHRFIASLQTKPFVILTGLSGSGKTKLAEAFSLWITDGFRKSQIYSKGERIKASRSTYIIKDFDRLGVVVGSEDSSKYFLPFELIHLWAKTILDNDYDTDTGAQEIESKVKESDSSFSPTSCHSPLKALAFKYIDSLNSENLSITNNQYCLIPVGADWTNREPLLGFPNALEVGNYVKPDSGALDLILRAEKDPSRPYFLILDEMNMSHVERYFADFLSAMESTDRTISLRPDTDDWKNCDVPASIILPENLFIIGTVNIDETTYMFSPKVLDRANVIEFRVTESEMESYFKEPNGLDMDSLRGAGASMGESFVAKAKEKSTVTDNLSNELMPFFVKLQEAGAEFGYRTASEISHFVSICSDIADTEMSENEVVDAAIMQKLLPKLHGSRNKIEKILKELGGLCLEGSTNQAFLMKDDKSDKHPVKYPLSYEKLHRMHTRVVADGFTSFAEA